MHEWIEVGKTFNGYMLLYRVSVGGGREYATDECGVGLKYVDFTVHSDKILLQIVEYEKNLRIQENEAST